VLRSLPIYPSAQDPSYYTHYLDPSKPWLGSTSTLSFRAFGSAQPVRDFYINSLMADGWEPDIVRQHLKKTLEISVGIHLSEQPPWIHRTRYKVDCEATVSAQQFQEVREAFDIRRDYVSVSVTLKVPGPVP
jgi:hypothetical protein